MTKKHRLDIFRVLNAIDKNDMHFYDNLTDDEKKSFQPVVVHQWLLGHSSRNRLQVLDGLVNTQLYNFYSFPKALYLLMVVSSDGKIKRYKYLKKKNKKTKTSIEIDIIKRYYKCGTTDAIEILELLTNDDLIDIAEDLGETKENITKLRKCAKC
jgi:hypothetical protein